MLKSWPMEKIRLNKLLQEQGLASRRRADAWILEGRVQVNGQVVRKLGTCVDTKNDQVKVDSRSLSSSSAKQKQIFLFHKPTGCLCSNVRKSQEKLVIDFFPKSLGRLFTVGRLDKDSTGLLLVTNDGDFSNQVIHPTKNLCKEYLVKVHRPLQENHLHKIRKGVFIDKKLYVPYKVQRRGKRVVSITVKEGKKHLVRKMVARADLFVLSLKRIRIGDVKIGQTKEGFYRRLTVREQNLLKS